MNKKDIKTRINKQSIHKHSGRIPIQQKSAFSLWKKNKTKKEKTGKVMKKVAENEKNKNKKTQKKTGGKKKGETYQKDMKR